MISILLTKIKNRFKKIKWVIRHPGNQDIMECDTFEECMEKWFEGFNLPYLVINGKPENSSVAYQRVKNYLHQLPHRDSIAK